VKKQLAIDTNEHLKDPEKRRKAVLQSVIASSRMEGIELSEEEIRKIDEKVEKRLKLQTKD
jgi:hypothetical protein